MYILFIIIYILDIIVKNPAHSLTNVNYCGNYSPSFSPTSLLYEVT